MKFQELTDEQWEFIQPLLPSQPVTGRPRADDRRTINGILYVLITGCKWEDMPIKYGAPVTAWRRLRRWQEEGVWERLIEMLQERAYHKGKLNLDEAIVDSSTIEAKKRGEAIGYDGYKKKRDSEQHTNQQEKHQDTKSRQTCKIQQRILQRQRSCRTILRMAAKLQKDCHKTRKTHQSLSSIHQPSQHPHPMEGFEMSSLLTEEKIFETSP